MKAVLFLGLILQAASFGVEVLKKPAVLYMPDQTVFETGRSYLLTAEIAFRWDGADPLKISIWKNKASNKNGRLLGDIEVFNEAGKKLERQFFVSIPPMPDGEVIIRPGEQSRYPFFVWNGTVTFPHPGRYYVIASFTEAWTGETNVQFTTSKCWIKVVEGVPKKSGL